jgi:hypothetical protein
MTTATTHRTYEVRCPIYGFITLNDWEWQIISLPAYQRLRRIRQLAWTTLPTYSKANPKLERPCFGAISSPVSWMRIVWITFSEIRSTAA